ncbi:MAG: hypothetical protein HW380_3962 [Magnetococcales bacterium]|nr:hypothetical protein [Magnetococcales bacterium]
MFFKSIAGVRGEVLPRAAVWKRQPTKVFLLVLTLYLSGKRIKTKTLGLRP